MPNGTTLQALCGLISEAELALTAPHLPKARARRIAELLHSAIRIADALVEAPAAAAHPRQIAGNREAPPAGTAGEPRQLASEIRRLADLLHREVRKLPLDNSGATRRVAQIRKPPLAALLKALRRWQKRGANSISGDSLPEILQSTPYHKAEHPDIE